jgi:hypothetical protein
LRKGWNPTTRLADSPLRFLFNVNADLKSKSQIGSWCRQEFSVPESNDRLLAVRDKLAVFLNLEKEHSG